MDNLQDLSVVQNTKQLPQIPCSTPWSPYFNLNPSSARRNEVESEFYEAV